MFRGIDILFYINSLKFLYTPDPPASFFPSVTNYAEVVAIDLSGNRTDALNTAYTISRLSRDISKDRSS